MCIGLLWRQVDAAHIATHRAARCLVCPHSLIVPPDGDRWSRTPRRGDGVRVPSRPLPGPRRARGPISVVLRGARASVGRTPHRARPRRRNAE
jgi:hypothetical protein